MKIIAIISLLLFNFPILASQVTDSGTERPSGVLHVASSSRESYSELEEALLKAKPTDPLRKALKAVLESPGLDQESDFLSEKAIRQELRDGSLRLQCLTQEEEFGSWFYRHLVRHIVYGKPERELDQPGIVASFGPHNLHSAQNGVMEFSLNLEDALQPLTFNDLALANSIAFAPWVLETMPFVLEKWTRTLEEAIYEEKDSGAINSLKTAVLNGPFGFGKSAGIVWEREQEGYELREPVPDILRFFSANPALSNYARFYEISGQMADHGKQLQEMIKAIAGEPS